ncbi:unnamed protein product, partial [Rotaria magnacalcarata]
GKVPVSIAVGDFDNDTILDLVIANSGEDSMSILLGGGDETFQNQTKYRVGPQPQSVIIGDFNNDSKFD